MHSATFWHLGFELRAGKFRDLGLYIRDSMAKLKTKWLLSHLCVFFFGILFGSSLHGLIILKLMFFVAVIRNE